MKRGSLKYLSVEERWPVAAVVVNEEPEKKERLNTEIENGTSIDRDLSRVRGTFIATAQERKLVER